MRRFKSKMGKRIMALLLSGTLVMSNMTVSASEYSKTEETVVETEEISETEGSEKVSTETENEVSETEKTETKKTETEETSETEETEKESKNDSTQEEMTSEDESTVEKTEDGGVSEEETDTEESKAEETETEESETEETETEEVAKKEDTSGEDTTTVSLEKNKDGKIDVWDFGAEALDTNTYNNMLTADIINSWYDGITGVISGEANTNNKILGFDVKDKENKTLLMFNPADTNASGKHKIITTNTDITRNQEKSLKDSEGNENVYKGYLFSDKNANTNVYLGIELDAGDILTLAVSTNTADSDINVLSPSGETQVQTHTLGKSMASVMEFYADIDGEYKIYSANDKLVVARIYVEDTKEVTVSGSVTAPSELSGYSIVFTNDQSGVETTANVSDGNYSTTLNEQYTYTVALKDANGYVIASSDTLDLAKDAGATTFDITVEAVSLHTVSGNITGLPENEVKKEGFKLTFKAKDEDKIYVPEISITTESWNESTGTPYELELEDGVTYIITAEGVNDYELKTTEITATADISDKAIEFEKKATYKVTISPEGATTDDLKDAEFIFKNIDEEGYEYTFTGTDNIELRDGVYSVTVKNSGIYVQQLTSNLRVNGADVTKTIKFKSDITEWDFRTDAYTGQESFNGAIIVGGSKHGDQYGMNIKNGSVTVPVKGACDVIVSVGYNWDITMPDSTNYKDDTNSGDIDLTYSYKGEEGTVTISVGELSSYIKKIQLIEKVEYKETLTVGAENCDYATINDALAAIKKMERPNNERVTIEIQPGDYEEMLVIDEANITLKNASATPSIETKDKGVNIDENAVRITSYYGHGYTYYSMGSDCKYSDEILEVNKANGSASFENPGSGTTAGSYWNATVVISADGFEADGIIFENSFNQYVSKKAANDVIVAQSGAKEGDVPRADMTYGDTAVQNKKYVERAAALAITNNCTELFFDNCKFIGRQDTLYGGTGVTAGFYDCSVYGGTDYIFGGMTAVFAKCDLVHNTMEDSNDKVYITAAQQKSGRGYLMWNCNITSTTPGVDTASEQTAKPGYFGRPWQADTSEVVFYATIIGAANDYTSLITPVGWNSSLSSTSDNVYEYGTYEMVEGIDNSASRADWSKVITEPKFADGTDITVEAFLGSWNPFADKDMTVVYPTEKITPPAPEVPTEPTVYTFESSALTAFAKGAKADGDTETAGTDNYFTLIYSASSNVSSSSKTWDDGYTSAQRVNFGGKASTEKNAVKFTTQCPSEVKVWWACGDAGRQMAILNSAGAEKAVTEEEAVKNSPYVSKLTLADAGTYYLGGATGNNYIFKVEVTEIPSDYERPARADWSGVTAPVITNVALSESKSAIDVTVNMNIGYDGADSVTVNMLTLDETGKETLIDSAKSAKEGTEVTVSITPEASGKYVFRAVASRENETDKTSELSTEFAFTLPLAKPIIKSATSLGGGKIEVEWNAVKEADSYVVEVVDTQIKVTTKETTAVVEGLEIRDEEYTINVYAVRGEEKGETSSIKAKATTEAQQKWGFSAFGSSISADTKNNGYEGNANDGSVRVYSINGKGKIVPNSTDGLAFYYTEIDPKTTNFTLTATAKVNNWTYSNGQEGFGLLATDRVGIHGDGSAFWNNSYMAAVTKVEYFWDGEKVSDAGNKISMKLGVGTLERIGVTPAGLDELASGATMPSTFTTVTDTLESSCASKGAGTYNIVGNCTNTPDGTINEPYTEFKLTIQKNNTGYFVSYYDPSTGKTNTNKYYDTEALSQLEKDTVYVGFFASRNADVTFEDISFTTIAPENDAPAEEKPVTYVTPSYQILSGSVSNSENYELVFNSNWDGQLVIRDALGVELANEKVKGNINTDASVDTKVKKSVKLNIGSNEFNITFTPDKNFAPDECTKLSSYDTQTFKHTVVYRKYGSEGQALYVSPDGTSNGVGTKENPLDIYTAVKYVQAGQTIILTEGTYNLTNTVKTERGINGTADKKIQMIADPNAATRPVLDFGGRCAGMVLAGDYWYFKGFDVTRSANGQKGIQLSGNYNVLDSINTYKNGNTGIQVSRYQGTDLTQAEWPSYNTILNCTSYLNADKGYEDADGFAAKLTIGPGNVFDGCIAHHNADDGWDLFAKAETGPIGKVVIQNCVAYKNGYVLRLDNGNGDLDLGGVEVNAGNGNGFKMGGESITGYHTLKNSVAFFNKAKGIDSNSCPDIQVYNSITFNNQNFNVAFYTNNAANTDYYAENLVSYRTEYKDINEQLKLKGTQDSAKVYSEKNYYWIDGKSANSAGTQAADDWFVSLEFTGADRNADGTINLHDFLKLSDKAGVSFALGGTASSEPVVGDETDGEVDKGDDTDNDNSSDLIPDDIPEDGIIPDGLWIAQIPDQIYTGTAVKPEVHVYMGKTLLTQGSQYSISFKNNKNANKAGETVLNETLIPTVTVTGKGSYEGFVTRTFNIQAVDLSSEYISADDITVATNGKVSQKNAAPTVTFNGKKLSKNKDFTIEANDADTENATAYMSFGTWKLTLTGKGNYTGTTTVNVNIVDKNDKNTVLINKAKVSKIAVQTYDGTAHTPAITVKVNNTLIDAAAYDVIYKNNVNVGTAAVVIKGKGLVGDKTYVGTKTVTFKIKGGKLNVNDYTVSGITYDNVNKAQYEGSAITFPNIKVELNAKDNVNVAKTLKLGTDYTVTYKNNRKAGKASVIIKGINNYSGSITKTFTILPYNIFTGKEVTGSNTLVDENGVSTISVSYAKGGSKPEMLLLVKGRKQILGTDYTVTYKNNKSVAAATDVKAPTAVIKGKNGLTGTIEVKFGITKMDLGNAESRVTVNAEDIVYKEGKAGNYYKSKSSVYEAGNKKISASEYTVEYYLNSVAEENKLSSFDADTIKSKVFDNAGNYVETKVIAQILAKETSKYYTGIISKEYRIVKTANLNKVKVAKLDPKYYGYDTKLYTADFNIKMDEETGLAVESKVTYGGKPLTCGVDFVIDNATFVNTGKVGTAKVTIRGIGSYGGSKVVSYKINKMSWSVAKALISDIEVVLASEKTELTAEDLKGKVILNGAALEYGKDFVIVEDTYKNNTKVGKAKVTIKGIGSYGGIKQITFNIIENK